MPCGFVQHQINTLFVVLLSPSPSLSFKELINILNSLKEQKEVIELELQHSDISLNAGGSISVKIPPII